VIVHAKLHGTAAAHVRLMHWSTNSSIPISNAWWALERALSRVERRRHLVAEGRNWSRSVSLRENTSGRRICHYR
jgi:hypothetical protein